MELELTKQITDLAIRATGLTVIDRATAEQADFFVALGKDLIKKIKGHYREIKQAIDESKRKILRLEELDLLKVEPLVESLGSSLSTWQTEERRKAREAEEKRLADERRRKELEEKTLREAQEKERQAKEATERAAREQDAAIRKQAQEEAARAQAEADKILAAAAKEEEKLGPSSALAPVIRPMAHSYARTVWKWRVQQPALVPRDLCKPDDSLIDRAVTRAKGQGLKPLEVKIPGVDVWEEVENVRRRT